MDISCPTCDAVIEVEIANMPDKAPCPACNRGIDFTPYKPHAKKKLVIGLGSSSRNSSSRQVTKPAPSSSRARSTRRPTENAAPSLGIVHFMLWTNAIACTFVGLGSLCIPLGAKEGKMGFALSMSAVLVIVCGSLAWGFFRAALGGLRKGDNFSVRLGILCIVHWIFSPMFIFGILGWRQLTKYQDWYIANLSEE